MNPLYKIGAIAVAVAALVAGGLYYRQSLISDGVKLESDRRNGLTNVALIEANAKTAKAQSEVTKLQGQLSKLQSENQSEQTASYIRESAFRAGNERMFAAFVQRGIGAAGSLGDTAAPAVDSGAAIIQDLTPEVAGNLESLRRNENDAIDRLDACIIAYEKIKIANDKLGK